MLKPSRALTFGIKCSTDKTNVVILRTNPNALIKSLVQVTKCPAFITSHASPEEVKQITSALLRPPLYSVFRQ